MAVTVTNMSTGDTLTFGGCTPREALVAAHGHLMKNGNTWTHEAMYGYAVEEGRHFLFLGDLAVRKA
jgi:hypothetical protein